MSYIRALMRTLEIYNTTKGTLVVQQAQLATSLGERLKGLLGRTGLAAEQGLILKPCSSIHTFFMRFAIDVLFVDKNMRVTKLIQNMPPNRLSPIILASKMTIELPAGKISQTNTQLGDRVEFRS